MLNDDEYAPEIRIKIPFDESQKLLERVALTHVWFADSLATYWQPGHWRYSSMCWLYCWAKNGRGKRETRDGARRAFDTIFEKPFDSPIRSGFYETAKKHRYSQSDIPPMF